MKQSDVDAVIERIRAASCAASGALSFACTDVAIRAALAPYVSDPTVPQGDVAQAFHEWAEREHKGCVTGLDASYVFGAGFAAAGHANEEELRQAYSEGRVNGRESVAAAPPVVERALESEDAAIEAAWREHENTLSYPFWSWATDVGGRFAADLDEAGPQDNVHAAQRASAFRAGVSEGRRGPMGSSDSDPAPPARGETVRVRICVLVDEEGNWISEGSGEMDDATMQQVANDMFDHAAGSERTTFIEADVPLPPQPAIVEAHVAPQSEWSVTE